MMRSKKVVLPVCAVLALGVSIGSSPARAAGQMEYMSPEEVIWKKRWIENAFPLTWKLHQDGVVNNSSSGLNAPGIVNNAEAVTELSEAFQAWENVPFSEIAVTYGGGTANPESGCDLENLVTWSDPTQTWGPYMIARGIATVYVGEKRTLDASASSRRIACGGTLVDLPLAPYPNGLILLPGTILDMDMTWNADFFDYVTAPDPMPETVDIQSVATHEFGHMFGLSHTSLAFGSSDPATMFPAVDPGNVPLQTNMTTLEADDQASSGRAYPSIGFWPEGQAPYTTGAISGTVLQPSGAAATGVRVWTYHVDDPSWPVYEAFTATIHEWDPGVSAGDYLMAGVTPGNYYVCILPWGNGVPTGYAADPTHFNETTTNGVGNTGFPAECYDDAQSSFDQPSPGDPGVRRVQVKAGQTTPHIDFVTGVQTSDFVLLMDRSGSMGLPAGGTAGISRLEALQVAAHAFIDYLDLAGGHRLGLVQFEEVPVPLSPPFYLKALDLGSAGDAHSAIDGMSAGGWTNIIAAVEEGIEQLTSISNPSSRQLMLLFSDGKHNRPVGSDLNDIHDPVVDNDITLYSVGFGTDVNDFTLSQVAVDSGGLHFNEQDLDPLSLGKHFLSIAASAADDATLSDPRYQLGVREAATLRVRVTPAERSLTFAVLWLTRDAGRVEVEVESPGGCRMAIRNWDAEIGLDVRAGETHQIVRIPLPYLCKGEEVIEGDWTIHATAPRSSGNSREEVQIVVFGSSRDRLLAEISRSPEGPVVTGRLLREGEVIRNGRLFADVTAPLPPTGDSEEEDAGRSTGGDRIEGRGPREGRTTRVPLYDDGGHGDAKARDGLFGNLLPVKAPGVHQVRLVWRDGQGGRREAVTSFWHLGEP